MSSAGGVVRVVTSSAATSVTTQSAKPAFVEISAARSSPTFSTQVVISTVWAKHRSCITCMDLIDFRNLGYVCIVSFSTKCSFNGLFSWTTWVSWHQKRKPFWILMKQVMEWQWHQLGCMQVICSLLQTCNHNSICTGQMLFLTPNRVKALKAIGCWSVCSLTSASGLKDEDTSQQIVAIYAQPLIGCKRRRTVSCKYWCLCISLCTVVMHNTAPNSFDNLPSYPRESKRENYQNSFLYKTDIICNCFHIFRYCAVMTTHLL